MNNKLKTTIIGGLMAGSLLLSTVPAMAWDWHWNNHDERDHQAYDRYDRYDRSGNNGWYDPAWGRLNGSRSDMDALQQARQQALYDASHHASRSKIAQDDAVVDEMVNRMHR